MGGSERTLIRAAPKERSCRDFGSIKHDYIPFTCQVSRTESAAQVALKLKYTPPAHFRFPVTCIGSKILIKALSYATRVEGGGGRPRA